MRFESKLLEIQTSGGTEIENLSIEIEAFIADSGIETGWLLVFAPGSTAGITTIEYETGALNDLRRALEQIAPQDGTYEHNLRWGDGNGYSHVRAALMGPSLTVPVADGRLSTGTWQQVVLCDFDNRPRRRKVQLELIGQ